MVTLMFILMLGFGFAFGLLVPAFRAEGTDGPLYLLRDHDVWLDVSAGSSLWQAMYAVFGEFDLAGITSSPGAAVVTPLIFYVYLFFITMPIVNLLIAMFSESYEGTTEGSARERWYLRDAGACIRFLRMYSAVPAPFNILADVGAATIWLGRQLLARLKRLRDGPPRATRHERANARGSRPPQRVLPSNAFTVDSSIEVTARDRYMEQQQNVAKREVTQQLLVLERNLRKSDSQLEQKLRETAASTEATLLRELKQSITQTLEPIKGLLETRKGDVHHEEETHEEETHEETDASLSPIVRSSVVPSVYRSQSTPSPVLSEQGKKALGRARASKANMST